MFENYEKDYIMRQIKMLGQLLARLLLRSDGVKYELPLKAPYSKADELHQALCRPVGQRERSTRRKTGSMRRSASWVSPACAWQLISICSSMSGTTPIWRRIISHALRLRMG